MRRHIALITESDKLLPYYVVDTGQQWPQEHIVRRQGYLYQWIQCIEGEGELILGGKAYRVKEGTAMLLLKGEPHEYYAITPNWTVDWIVFDGQQVEQFFNITAGITKSQLFYISRPDLFLGRIQSVIDIGYSDATLKNIQCSSIIYGLLTDIMLYASTQPDSSATHLNARLKPLFNYIEQHVSKPLALDELAKVADYTPQHLCTVFKRTTGIRIFQYINSVRIKKSKELLLQHPHLQVKKIAGLVGFEDVNYFCTVFKKHEQLSPGQFRKVQLNSVEGLHVSGK